jgi:1,4-dihydroxy-2-naphthoyl-CoA hydrolase
MSRDQPNGSPFWRSVLNNPDATALRPYAPIRLNATFPGSFVCYDSRTMPDETAQPKSWIEEGIESGFDDAWHEQWWRNMEEGGGNIIAAMRMRFVEISDERVVMEMPMGPAVRQGTGIFAAGALIQLADVAATSAYFQWARSKYPEGEAPFPLSIQISTNLLRNTDKGLVRSETVLTHKGRILVVAESRVTDEAGRLLAIVTSTHTPAPTNR